MKVGFQAAEREILAAAERALAEAGGGKLASVCLGLAGADRPEVAGPILRWLRRRMPARSYLVTTDAEIALEAATGRLPVVMLIAGTGSIACARDSDGNLIRVGGWGSTFDDAGSGFDIGRQGVRAALRAADGRGPATRLIKTLPRALKVRDPREIVGLGLGPAQIAALAPAVIRCGRSGDAIALGIVDEAGGELAALALTVIRSLKFEDRPVSVVCAGGLLQASRLMRRVLARRLEARAPLVRVTRLRRQPVHGALALALKGKLPGTHRGGTELSARLQLT